MPVKLSDKFATSYVCGTENSLGLNVPFVPYDKNGSCARYTARPEHAGWKNILHGGVTFALMDEALGWSLYYQGLRGVTAKAEVRFRAPILVGTPVRITAFTCGRARQIVRARAEVRREDETAELLAEVKATMYLIEDDERNGEGAMLITERKNAVLLITLNRPEKRNCLHPDLISELSQTLARSEKDESLNVVVLTGAGSSFCAGLDLIYLLGLDSEARVAYMQTVFELFRQLYAQPQPVIAAVNGPAIAGGFDLAALCDLRFCTPEATFAQTEVLLGITQIMYPLYKVIGLGRAKELALTGEAISAEEAYRIGLVNRMYPSGELLDQTMKSAHTIAGRPRQALFATKRLSRDLTHMDTESAFQRMFAVISERLKSEEHRQEAEKYVAQLKRRREMKASRKTRVNGG